MSSLTSIRIRWHCREVSRAYREHFGKASGRSCLSSIPALSSSASCPIMDLPWVAKLDLLSREVEGPIIVALQSTGLSYYESDVKARSTSSSKSGSSRSALRAHAR